MNTRIEVIDANTVTVYGRVKAAVKCSTMGLCVDYFETLDQSAVKAMIEVLNCYLATGDFAALADTSAVPFVGKWLRIEGSGDRTFKVIEMIDGLVRFSHSSALYHVDMLRPLAPVPKYRPYTPAEATNHFGRLALVNGVNWELCCVTSNRVELRNTENNWSLTMPYAEFQNNTWADTGEPCGVLESEESK